jgi:hypothetical protein
LTFSLPQLGRTRNFVVQRTLKRPDKPLLRGGLLATANVESSLDALLVSTISLLNNFVLKLALVEFLDGSLAATGFESPLHAFFVSSISLFNGSLAAANVESSLDALLVSTISLLEGIDGRERLSNCIVISRDIN